MSLIDSASQLMEIKLYYEERKTKWGFVKFIPLENDEESEKKFKEQEAEVLRKQDNGEPVTHADRPIKILVTKWKIMTWGEQNKITKQSEVQMPRGPNGLPSTEIDYFRFRDLRLKTCLVEWDLKDDKDATVPVTHENIDRLSSDVVSALMVKYDEILSYEAEETEKN